MLEILALIFLTRDVGKIALKKGLKPGRWKLYAVLAWFAGEIPGIVFGLLLFEPNNLISIELVAVAGALTGFLILRSALLKKPDSIENEIEQIGNNT